MSKGLTKVRLIMLQKILRFGVIGGLILFVWTVIVWAVLPWQKHQMKAFTNEKSVSAVIRDNASTSGLYVMPNLNEYTDADDLNRAKARMEKGPFIVAFVSLDGRSSEMIGPMVRSLILKVIIACLLAWVLLQLKLKQSKKLKFCSVIAIVLALSETMPCLIWFGCPLTFALFSFLEMGIGWFLVTLAMMKMITPKNG